MAFASNYMKVYKDWLKANRVLSIDSTIPIEVLLIGLRFSDVLSKFERRLVDAEKTDDEKLLKLFTEIMPAKGEQGFNQVVEILTENKCIELTIDLIKGLNKKCAANSLHYPVKALDVGCATGENTRLLTYFNNIQQVVAFDVDTEMVAHAECFNGDKKIHFTVADVQHVAAWPKPNQNEFDLVTSFHVLHWAEDQQRALENIHRSMKPNGVFLARLLGKLVANDLLDFVNKSEKWSKYAVSYLIRPQPWMKEEDPAKYYENLLKKAGFSVVTCKNETETMKMSKEDASDYLKMTRLHRFKVPVENYEEFCDECFTFFFKNQRNEEDNTYNMIYHCIDVVARC